MDRPTDKDMNLHYQMAFALRLALVAYGDLQDSFLDVKYTDVDYEVFSDAAESLSRGHSPFMRPTYRYSPLIALALVPNVLLHPAFGKVLFSVLDVLAGWLLYRVQWASGQDHGICRRSGLLWLYNPMAMVICTRGSAESIATCIILASLLLHRTRRPLLAGIALGLAVHCRLYPCIYAPAFYFSLAPEGKSSGWRDLRPDGKRLRLVLGSVLGFLVPTALSFAFCGERYVREAFLYHLLRRDIRHNFSPYFYALYLCEGLPPMYSTLVSVAGLALQAGLVLAFAWVFRRNLHACLLLQTIAFVAFNKVCTSQYFLWYLCLMPLNYTALGCRTAKGVSACVGAWLAGQALWLLPAYRLEFEGRNTFSLLWAASLLFFLVNAWLLKVLAESISRHDRDVKVE